MLALLAGVACGPPDPNPSSALAGGAASDASPRATPELNSEVLLAAAGAAGEHLLAHQGEDGRFHDPYRPEEDVEGPAANLRRQAKASWALLRLYGVTEDPAFLAGGERGLAPLLGRLRGPEPEEEGVGFRAVADEEGDAPLGPSALLLLALLEHRAVTRSERWQEPMAALARFLTYQQQPDGRFEPGDPPEETPFPLPGDAGQATLALVRFARLDPTFTSSRWYNAAERGAGWMMGVRDLGKTYDRLPEDLWLMGTLDELHELSGGGRTYFLHARRTAQGILDDMEGEGPGPSGLPPRTVVTARRAAILATMVKIARRAGVDDGPYVRALRATMAVLLEAQVTGEEASGLPRPELAAGGLRRSLEESALPLDAASYLAAVALASRALLPPGP